MPLAMNVTLPNEQEPVWPAVCVRCGAFEPDAQFAFKSERVSWLSLALVTWLPFGHRQKVKAPACQACVKQLKRERRMHQMAEWIFLIVACAGVVYALTASGWFGGAWKPYRKWAALAGCAVVALPFFVYQLFNPPLVNSTTRGKKTDYELRDPAYARLFAELNDAELW